jgi:hypothetical protein
LDSTRDLTELVDPLDLSYIARQLPWRPDVTVVNFNHLEPHVRDLGRFEWSGTAIIDASLDPWWIPPDLDDAWQGRDYWVLTNESQDPRPRHIYVPLWFWQYSERWRDHPRLPLEPARRWAMSCLNRFPRLHRYYVIRAVMSRPWRDRSVLSLGRLDWDPYNLCRIRIGRRAVDHELWLDLAEWAYQQQLPLQDHPEPDQVDTNDHSLEHPAYWDTGCNIITETSMDSSGFMSEKTAKALAAGQLWCMISGSDTVNQLARLGFDVMSDVWQGHQYLLLDQWYQRIDAVMPLLDRVAQDLESLWHQTRAAREHNQAWLFSDELTRRVLQPLWDRELLVRS